MDFGVSVTVRDGDEEYTAVSENANDLSLIKKNVHMRRSYKTRPRKKGDVLTNYRFTAFIVSDGSEFTLNYKSPAEIEIAACTNSPFSMNILGMAVYKKATDSVQITKLNLFFGMDVYADPCEDSAYTEQLTRVIACFRALHEITPVSFGAGLKLEIKVFLDSDDPYNKAVLKRETDAEKIARCVNGAKKRLSEFDLLAKLKK